MFRKRPYLTLEMCEAVRLAPVRVVEQEDGRRRFWGRVDLPGDAKRRILRVVTLADCETIHNGFIDRDFRLEEE